MNVGALVIHRVGGSEELNPDSGPRVLFTIEIVRYNVMLLILILLPSLVANEYTGLKML